MRTSARLYETHLYICNEYLDKSHTVDDVCVLQ
jgi:hypothetical protein